MDGWHGAAQDLVELDLRYTRQVLAALLPMCLTVLWHGFGINLVHRFFRRFGRPALQHRHGIERSMVVVGCVGLLLVTHFGGVVIWAAFYFLVDLVNDVGKAMVYSMNAYTTLGASDIHLPRSWLGFGNFESMTAMLMFGWSTAVLANIVQRFHTIDD